MVDDLHTSSSAELVINTRTGGEGNSEITPGLDTTSYEVFFFVSGGYAPG